MQIGENWMKWAFLEGLTKTAKRSLFKFSGLEVKILAGSFAINFWVGQIQALGGLIGARLRHQSLNIGRVGVLLGILFGITASLMDMLTITAFTFKGADIGVITFIMTASIVPGAFADWIFFGYPLNVRQMSGVAVFLIGGWAVLDFPDLNALLDLPLWLGLAVLASVLGACNEAFSQATAQTSKKIDPLVNNFWVGTTTLIFSFCSLAALGKLPMIFSFRVIMAVVIFGMGLLTLAMISFKLLSYKGGGHIALKKLVMNSSQLVTSILAGAIFYGEELTAGKWMGVVGFAIAFSLMDRGTWEYILSILSHPVAMKN